MQIRFEQWYQNQPISNESHKLFNESILCYKVGAYGAAFIMTYLGFQIILKERLIKAEQKPDNITDKFWEESINKLDDDDIWDNTVFDMVNRQKPDNPFLIGDNIRTKYAYWRTIRNDCAHAKDSIVDHSHVESFWLFIESHFYKFIVNGGKAGMLDRVKRYYDHRYTPSNTDIKPIINDIPRAMKIKELPDFFKEVIEYSRELEPYSAFTEESITYDFWYNIANATEEVLRESFIEFIKSDWDIFNEFILVFPEKLLEVSSDSSFIREFWADKIKKILWSGEDNEWKIITTLINNKVVPDEELDKFIAIVYKGIKVNPPMYMVEPLKETSYFMLMKKELFEKNKMSTPYRGIEFANYNWRRIKFYITYIGLDELVVKEINSAYTAAVYGTFYDGMNKLFKSNTGLKQKYKGIIEEFNLTMPKELED